MTSKPTPAEQLALGARSILAGSLPSLKTVEPDDAETRLLEQAESAAAAESETTDATEPTALTGAPPLNLESAFTLAREVRRLSREAAHHSLTRLQRIMASEEALRETLFIQYELKHVQDDVERYLANAAECDRIWESIQAEDDS